MRRSKWTFRLSDLFTLRDRFPAVLNARLGVEPLEDRLTPAVVTWGGAGATPSFTDPANWVGGVVPTVADDAVINTATPVVVSVDGSAVGVASLTTNQSLSVTGGGQLSVSGALAVAAGKALTADGAGSKIAVAGGAAADGVSLLAYNGGLVSLPGLTGYSVPAGGVTLRASGSGSRLALTGLTGLTLGAGGTVVTAMAEGGGVVDLSKLAQAGDPAGGAVPTGQYLKIVADGAGSLVNLSKLASLTDRHPGSYDTSTLEAYNGGEVRAPLLTTLDNAGVVVDGLASKLPVAQYTSITHGFVTVAGVGVNPAFTKLADVTGSSLAATGGATLALPGVATYAVDAGYATLRASGTGSRLDLSGLTDLSLGAGGTVAYALAEGGGVVDLSHVARAGDPAGGAAPENQYVKVVADGAASRVDLSGLTALVDRRSGSYNT